MTAGIHTKLTSQTVHRVLAVVMVAAMVLQMAAPFALHLHRAWQWHKSLDAYELAHATNFRLAPHQVHWVKMGKELSIGNDHYDVIEIHYNGAENLYLIKAVFDKTEKALKQGLSLLLHSESHRQLKLVLLNQWLNPAYCETQWTICPPQTDIQNQVEYPYTKQVMPGYLSLHHQPPQNAGSIV